MDHVALLSPIGLERLGLETAERHAWNLPAAALIEASLQRGEAHLACNGALCATTGRFTGRTPDNRFVVRDAETESVVNWGKVNHPLSPEVFERLYQRMLRHAGARDLFIQDCFAGADPAYRMPVRVVTELAWQALFARQLLICPRVEELDAFHPEFSVLCLPGCHAEPGDGVPDDVFVVINFTQRLVLIGGTAYAGEIKKSIFSVLNFLLPRRGVFPMHCSANVGPGGDAALFFGLSGTGKTTLSADPERRLIGDDEHGWSDAGLFNFEGGCYAKCIRLSPQGEPQIWNAIRFGTVLENVTLDAATRALDFNDDSRTENTRAAYPLEFIENAVIPGQGPHPRCLIFLTADAFGVLPPVARLSVPQAMYHFLSGYTAKIAGTEAGVKEPTPNFSTCFGAPFWPLPPLVYARLLGERLRQHRVSCWLVNTGWTGGPYGVGKRMRLAYTRSMVKAVLAGELDRGRFRPEPIFGLELPTHVAGVPDAVLDPASTWADAAAYETAARDLAARFIDNFRQFEIDDAEILAAAPKMIGG
ncbi:MAG: phosphoenolpyruvate carboxykinase (ATP) [Terriglobales bacterium]